MYFQHIASGLSCVLFVMSLVPSAAQTKPAGQKADAKQTTEKVGEEDSHLTDALAQWLVNGNKAEIELGKLASEKASAPK